MNDEEKLLRTSEGSTYIFNNDNNHNNHNHGQRHDPPGGEDQQQHQHIFNAIDLEEISIINTIIY